MKRLTVVSLLVLAILSMTGFAYAKWSKELTVTTNVQTGDVSIAWQQNSEFTKEGSNGIKEWTCDYGFKNIRPAVEGKDVGETIVTFSDEDNDSLLDRMNVVINNAYPCYYNEISGTIEVLGTIPVIIQKTKLHWMGNTYVIDDYKPYLLYDDGTIRLYPCPLDPATATAWAETPGTGLNGGDPVIEFVWLNNVGQQLHQGMTPEDSFRIHVVQCAKQNTTYQFSFEVEAVQWNESAIPAVNPAPNI